MPVRTTWNSGEAPNEVPDGTLFEVLKAAVTARGPICGINCKPEDTDRYRAFHNGFEELTDWDAPSPAQIDFRERLEDLMRRYDGASHFLKSTRM